LATISHQDKYNSTTKTLYIYDIHMLLLQSQLTEMKAEPSQLIPRKPTENLELLIVAHRIIYFLSIPLL